MSNASAKSSTNGRRLMTGEQAKACLQAKGMTLREFAELHKFQYRTVSEVVRGVNRGLYGEGHKVAVALGMK